MKEKYSRPSVTNADMTENVGVAPWGLVAKAGALLIGYAISRAITNAAKASPYSKTPSLTNHSSN